MKNIHLVFKTNESVLVYSLFHLAEGRIEKENLFNRTVSQGVELLLSGTIEKMEVYIVEDKSAEH